MKRFPLLARIVIPLVSVVGIVGVMSIMSGLMRPGLSNAARTAIGQGLAAVQKQDFPLADQYFQQARVIGPASHVFAAIGQGELKIPGRELRAICWLSASLAANPAAPDAEATKGLINFLDMSSRSKIYRLIASAEKAALLMAPGEPRDRTLRRLADLWETFGDEKQARKIIDLIEGKGAKSDAFSTLACAYVEKDRRRHRHR